MTNIIDFKSMVSKLRNIDPTSFQDMKKQIVESVQTAPEHDIPSTPVADLRKLSGMPEAEMSKKSIKKVRKTVDKMDDKPKAKKSISKWAKGKFDDPKSAMFAIATNMQKRKEGKPIDPPGRESISHIGKALIDTPKTVAGKIEEAMRSPNFKIEDAKFQGKFKKGDMIKAYDYQPMQGRDEKFIVGKVVAVDKESKTQPGAMGYHVKVEQDTLFDKNSREGKIVFVPYEVGMDYDERLSMMEDGHTDTDSMQGITAQMAKDVMQLNQMFKDNPGDEELMTWITNKLAVAADKISSVKDYMMNPTQDKPTDEGKMSDIALDMEQLSDMQFTSKYKKSKKEMKKELSDDTDEPQEGNAYAHAVRKAKMDGKKKGDKVKGPDGEEITLEKDPEHEALVDKTIKTLETYLDLVSKQGNKKLSKATEDVRKVFGMESKAKPDYIDIDKDGDKKEPMKKAAKDAKKKKMSMDEKVQLLNIGKQIREMAKANGVQPSQFLGYLVAKNPEKYGPLAKLEDIIDGKG
jgi:hypothetical protein